MPTLIHTYIERMPVMTVLPLVGVAFEFSIGQDEEHTSMECCGFDLTVELVP
jgi:hypothetical protein